MTDPTPTDTPPLGDETADDAPWLSNPVSREGVNVTERTAGSGLARSPDSPRLLVLPLIHVFRTNRHDR